MTLNPGNASKLPRKNKPSDQLGLDALVSPNTFVTLFDPETVVSPQPRSTRDDSLDDVARSWMATQTFEGTIEK
jgi:hypothetical protein